MTIQIDSREKPKERIRIEAQLDRLGVQHFCSKLYAGDYASLDRPRLCVDRKKNLLELCGNVTQDHERFRKELLRAQEAGIRLIFLVEHGFPIFELRDVPCWTNPRRRTSPKATSGEQLYKTLCTIRDRYNTDFLFCAPDDTGRTLTEILG